ncbi:MAG TPA: VOC family protein [Acidimicrobiia bacterium]|nr:VOC family protein [Acidimicrobiia bacterium]
MLGDRDVTTMIAVKDAAEAARFYEDVLGLAPLDRSPTVMRYRSGSSKLVVYESETAGTNRATTALWTVDDLEGTVAALRAKGVAFDHYDDLPGVTRDGDVHDLGAFKTAWFQDPSGNTFEVNEGVDLGALQA